MLVVLLFCTPACAEPPNKEMNQAQGAIDGARAAGADQYAAAELAAAVDALKRSEDAVAQRDYRLALNHAIDSRARAQSAAKQAAEARAKARGDAERLVAEAGAVLAKARERLQDPSLARSARRGVAEARRVVAAAEKSMQDARAALVANDYTRAATVAARVSKEIPAVLKTIDAADAPSPSRRRR